MIPFADPLIEERLWSRVDQSSARNAPMSNALIGSALRLLIAAVLCSLFVLPAAAHPGHGHDTSAPTATALDALVELGNAGNVGQHLTAPFALAFLSSSSSSSCCCRQSGSSVGSGCGCGMAYGSGSCGHASSVLAAWHAVHIAPAVKGVGACLTGQLQPGDAPGPGERPPRI